MFSHDEKKELRAEYPLTRTLAYLNHAAVGPLSTASCDAMRRHAEGQRDRGVADWREWNATIDSLRAVAAELIGATPADVAVLKNTTEGLSLVASGLPWEAGDNVVLSDMEFPSNELPWTALASRGVEVRRIRTGGIGFTPVQVRELVDEKTRVVTLSSVAFHNGFRPDLEAISAICVQAGAHLVVDGIQSVGALRTNVVKSGISFLAADGHKWMLGPEGVAIFYASAAAREELGPWPVGWRSLETPQIAFDSGVPVTADLRRLEGGVVNTNGCYGLEASIRRLLEIGPDRIEEEVKGLARTLAEELTEVGWEVLTPSPGESGIISARPETLDEEQAISIEEEFLDAGVAVAGRMGAIRFSPHFYTDHEDLERAVEVARNWNG